MESVGDKNILLERDCVSSFELVGTSWCTYVLPFLSFNQPGIHDVHVTERFAREILGEAESLLFVLSRTDTTVVGWRPLLVGWRPSLLGWRPLPLGWRPSLVGWRPSHEHPSAL